MAAEMDFQRMLEGLMADAERMVNAKRVVGEPFQVGDITLIPIVTAVVGVGAGGGTGRGPQEGGRTTGEGTGGGGGLGMRLVPNALAAIVDGELRVYSLGGRGALEKLVDLVPELVQKLGAQMGKGRTEEKTEEAS